MPDDHELVKLDFSNAFNSLHRHDMLLAVLNRVPELYALTVVLRTATRQPCFLAPIRSHLRKGLNKVTHSAPFYSATQFSHCFLHWLLNLTWATWTM